jgi:hypothetical protein
MRRGALLTLVALLLPAAGAEPAAASGLQDQEARQSGARDARADTARARVLERLRGPAPTRTDDHGLDTLRVRDADELRLEAADTLPEEARPADDRRRRQPARRADLPQDADSVMRALAQLPGYRPSTYSGTRAEFQGGIMVLHGTEEHRARFSGDGVILEADSSITYHDERGRVWTRGPTTLTPEEGDRVVSSSLIYDLREERGTATSAQTTYTEGALWIVQGDLPSVRHGELFGSDARFTSCDLHPPHSHFRARELKVVQDRVLVARSVQMYVEDVPVMWLPFIAQNLESGRASGLLTPTFSMNDVVRTSTGHNRRLSNIGAYWAMSDYSDATVAMDWFSNNYTALTGSMRYRWSRQFLDGNADVRHFWRAEGGRELTFATRHNWVASERTRVRANARYVSSTRFVTQNTFDPRELNQTIDSDAGLTHRFDWGQLSLGANRKQFLNEDRTDMTLPTANLSLSTITLFGAPPQRASWYNNMSLSGSSSWTRNLQERPFMEEDAFNFRQTSQLRTRGSARGSLGLGRLSLSGNLNLDETVFRDVPVGLFGVGEEEELLPGVRDDMREAQLGWSTSLGFQQRLFGSTTFTPSVSVDGRLMRVDTIPEAQEFVSGPARMSVSAGLQTDLYGFYPGFGQFEAIRHKVTPNARWSYAPAVTPTELQERVFGARDARVRNQVVFGVNQTWEARVREPTPEERARERRAAPPEDLEDPFREEPEEVPPPPLPGEPAVRDTVEILRGVEPEEAEEEEVDELAPTALDEDDGLERLPESRVVMLLALQTSAVTYDLVQRDETGNFLDGFQTTVLSNSVRSDYLRGLNLSFQHDLFDDRAVPDGGPRRFRPHLSQLSFSFSMNHQSGLIRALGRLVGAEPPDPEDVDEELPEGAARGVDPGDPAAREQGYDPSRMMPDEPTARTDDLDRERVGAGWNARISYSLRRPRETAPTVGSSLRAQMIQTSLSFRPSQNWEASWSTSYDVEAGRFNDHMVSLRRDLHEWEATFGFRQTATGNWSFQFEISLRANRDLQLDFEQRSLEGRGLGAGGPGAGGPR